MVRRIALIFEIVWTEYVNSIGEIFLCYTLMLCRY